MQQSRVEPYVGTSSSLRAASADVGPMRPFGTAPHDDQYTVAIPEAERTIDIPISGQEFEPTLTYDMHAIAASPTAAAEVQVGATLRKRYVLHRLIGTGGTCHVFLAEDLHRRLPPEAGGELIALKVLRPGHGAYSLQRLRREFLQMQQLSHVSITRVFDLDCDGDTWFMTMELVDAPSALTWMNGDYSNAEALRVILACCDAVDHAHRKGIVHGDLKPGNVLVLPDASVKLIDFGSVAEFTESSDTAKLEATPQYASPAVLAGNMAEVRDDVFSLGCLAYMILARGQHPFDRKPSSEAANAQLQAPYIPGIALRMFEVVARALAWDPAQRHGSVRELQHALLAAELTRAQPSVPHQSMQGVTAVMERPLGTEIQPSFPRTDVHGVTAVMQSPQGAGTQPGSPRTDAHGAVTLIRPGAVPPQAAAANAKPVTPPPPHPDKSANTPGDYSYLNKFRGYVAGPMLESKPHRHALEDELQELEAMLPPAAPGPAGFVPQPLHTAPATRAPTAQREPRVEHRPARQPARSKRTLVSAVGLSLLVAAGFGAARLSGPAPKQESAALVTPPVDPAPVSAPPVSPLVLTLATPELTPMSLPRQRAPLVRIAASKPAKPDQPKPARQRPEPAPAVMAATRSAPAAKVSFESRTVEVSPNQTLVAIPIRRSNSNRGAARVAWQIEGGSGPELLDAERAGAQMIQFHAGQAERMLYVPLRKEAGELAADGLRTFRVKLRQVKDGPSPGRVAEVRVTLLD
jgi:serine/threonine protein kinase